MENHPACGINSSDSRRLIFAAASLTRRPRLTDRHHVSALAGGVSYEVDAYIAYFAKFFVKAWIDIRCNTVRIKLLKTICRLIQSHTQLGPASAGTCEVKDQILIFGLIRLEHLRQLRARAVCNN